MKLLASRICDQLYIVSFVLFIIAVALHWNGEIEIASLFKTFVIGVLFVREGLT